MPCSHTCLSERSTASYPLDTIDFFTLMPKAELASLHEKGHTLKTKKGQLLFAQGDKATSFYMIESGWVKLFRETMDGEEVILDILPAGHIFAENLPQEGDIYPFAAEVIEDGRITAYPLSTLRTALRDVPGLALGMLHHMNAINTLREKDIEHLTIMRAPQRIGCFLLRLCKVRQTPPVILYLPYDKLLLAARLGMQPETFSRALGRLQADTGIKIQGMRVEITDLDALIKYTCSACSNMFPCGD